MARSWNSVGPCILEIFCSCAIGPAFNYKSAAFPPQDYLSRTFLFIFQISLQFQANNFWPLQYAVYRVRLGEMLTRISH